MATLKPWVGKAKKIGTYVAILLVVGGVYYGVTHASKKVGESQKLDQISTAPGFNEVLKTTDKQIPLADFNNPVGPRNGPSL